MTNFVHQATFLFLLFVTVGKIELVKTTQYTKVIPKNQINNTFISKELINLTIITLQRQASMKKKIGIKCLQLRKGTSLKSITTTNLVNSYPNPK